MEKSLMVLYVELHQGGVEIMGLIGIPRGELMQIFQPAFMEFAKCAENLGIRVAEELSKDDPMN